MPSTSLARPGSVSNDAALIDDVQIVLLCDGAKAAAEPERKARKAAVFIVVACVVEFSCWVQTKGVDNGLKWSA